MCEDIAHVDLMHDVIHRPGPRPWEPWSRGPRYGLVLLPAGSAGSLGLAPLPSIWCEVVSSPQGSVASVGGSGTRALFLHPVNTAGWGVLCDGRATSVGPLSRWVYPLDSELAADCGFLWQPAAGPHLTASL